MSSHCFTHIFQNNNNSNHSSLRGLTCQTTSTTCSQFVRKSGKLHDLSSWASIRTNDTFLVPSTGQAIKEQNHYMSLQFILNCGTLYHHNDSSQMNNKLPPILPDCCSTFCMWSPMETKNIVRSTKRAAPLSPSLLDQSFHQSRWSLIKLTNQAVLRNQDSLTMTTVFLT